MDIDFNMHNEYKKCRVMRNKFSIKKLIKKKIF